MGIRTIWMDKRATKSEQNLLFYHDFTHFVLDDFDQRYAHPMFIELSEWRANIGALYASMPRKLVGEQFRHHGAVTYHDIARAFDVPLWAAKKRVEQIYYDPYQNLGVR